MGYYKMHTTRQTWLEARRTCEREGAHLIVLNSEPEAQWVQDMLARRLSLTNVSNSYQDGAFIGFHDMYAEGYFVTVLGDSLLDTGFTRWADKSQPHNGRGNYDAESDCGAVYKNGGLDDLGCNYKFAFFCEQEL